MTIALSELQLSASRRRPFAMIEVIVGVAIMGIALVSLFAGMSASTSITKYSRENLRATQIMIERMEGIRLYNWSQLTSSNWIPTNFTTSYYPFAGTGESTGITYPVFTTVTVTTLSPDVTYT